jgi:hypothetical protein
VQASAWKGIDEAVSLRTHHIWISRGIGVAALLLWFDWRSVTTGESASGLVVVHHYVVVRIMHHSAACPRAHGEKYRYLRGSILQAMSHWGPRGPRSRITCLECGFLIFNEHKFTGEHEDKLILCFVPMPMRGPRAGWKLLQMDTELRQCNLVTEYELGVRAIGLTRHSVGGAGVALPLIRAELRHGLSSE